MSFKEYLNEVEMGASHPVYHVSLIIKSSEDIGKPTEDLLAKAKKSIKTALEPLGLDVAFGYTWVGADTEAI